MVATLDAAGCDEAGLARLMIGRDLSGHAGPGAARRTRLPRC
jgi:hypothetical protein